MLAQSFKTAAELNISSEEHAALVAVMKMFERGEISPHQFGMSSVETWCGTRACIMGWCQRIGGPELFSGFIDDNKPLFNGLFMFGDNRRFLKHEPENAAIAIRSYLVSGKAHWLDAAPAVTSKER